MPRLAALLLLALLAPPSLAQPNPAPPARQRVAALTLSGPPTLPDATRRYLTDVLRARLSVLPPTLLVLTQENLLALLPPGADLAACLGACEVETGRNLGASYVLSGGAARLGVAWRLSLRLHETISGALLGASTAEAGSETGLEAAVIEAARPLIQILRARHPGPLPLPASAPAASPAAPSPPEALPLADQLSYAEALAFERGAASPQDKAARWGRLKARPGWLGAEARARQRHWRRAARQAARQASEARAEAARMAEDWARLQPLLADPATPPIRRQQLAARFVATYGEAHPHFGALSPHLAGALIDWALIPGDPTRGIAAFELSRAEVSVAVYRRCVDLGHCTPPGDWPGCNWAAPERADHPVNCVSWSQARRFAAWMGARLPTAAEWRLAAGGVAPWPWGHAPPDPHRAVLAAEGTTPPCVRPAGTSVHGVCDLIGNVEEWLQGPPPSRVGGGFRAALDADLTTPRPGAPLDSAALGFRLCRPLAEEIP